MFAGAKKGNLKEVLRLLDEGEVKESRDEVYFIYKVELSSLRTEPFNRTGTPISWRLPLGVMSPW